MADLSCYPDALSFARAVSDAIKYDPEWYVLLKPEAIAERVTTSYMQYSFLFEWDDAIRDTKNKGGYYLQDRATPEEQVMDRLRGLEPFMPQRWDIKVWYVDLEDMPMEATIEK